MTVVDVSICVHFSFLGCVKICFARPQLLHDLLWHFLRKESIYNIYIYIFVLCVVSRLGLHPLKVVCCSVVVFLFFSHSDQVSSHVAGAVSSTQRKITCGVILDHDSYVGRARVRSVAQPEPQTCWEFTEPAQRLTHRHKEPHLRV